MKKTFELNINGKNRDRLLDASKHAIRKYIKRERTKALPENADFWDFNCMVGVSVKTALPVHLAEIMAAVDVLVKDGAVQFYVEIISKLGYRATRDSVATTGENARQVL